MRLAYTSRKCLGCLPHNTSIHTKTHLYNMLKICQNIGYFLKDLVKFVSFNVLYILCTHKYDVISDPHINKMAAPMVKVTWWKFIKSVLISLIQRTCRLKQSNMSTAIPNRCLVPWILSFLKGVVGRPTFKKKHFLRVYGIG